MVRENPGSKWPKTSVACLRDDKVLTLEQLSKLRRICRFSSPSKVSVTGPTHPVLGSQTDSRYESLFLLDAPRTQCFRQSLHDLWTSHREVASLTLGSRGLSDVVQMSNTFSRRERALCL